MHASAFTLTRQGVFIEPPQRIVQTFTSLPSTKFVGHFASSSRAFKLFVVFQNPPSNHPQLRYSFCFCLTLGYTGRAGGAFCFSGPFRPPLVHTRLFGTVAAPAHRAFTIKLWGSFVPSFSGGFSDTPSKDLFGGRQENRQDTEAKFVLI